MVPNISGPTNGLKVCVCVCGGEGGGAVEGLLGGIVSVFKIK